MLGIRRVDIGQYVSPGTPMVTLQQLDPIYVDFPIPEQNMALLRVGQAVEIKVDAYPGTVFTGRVQSIDARVEQETRNLLVRATVSNGDGRLLPGMFANISVLTGTPQEVVTLPRTAVSYSLYGDSVYVVVDAGGDAAAADASAEQAADAPAGGPMLVAERRFVVVRESRNGTVAIIKGVYAGEQVVTSGQLKLRPGAPVVIDNSVPLDAPALRAKE